MSSVVDPIAFAQLAWPHIYFYKEQKDIIYSICNNVETYSPAGNMLGKDFVGGFIALYFFMTRFPCRIVTTSVRDDHLDVLWGEINRFIQDSRVAMKKEDGGPLIVNYHHIKRWIPDKYNEQGQLIREGRESPLCYIKGLVTGVNAEGMSGHHVPNIGDGIPRAMLIEDEASGCSDEVHQKGKAWFDRFLAIGNCWDCENHFKYAVKGKPGTNDKGGDQLLDEDHPEKGYQRKVIQIKGIHSPNVRRALAQIKAGLDPDNKIIVPGVLSWEKYQSRRKFWDAIEQCIGLDAEFYEGAQNYLIPSKWLDLAEEIAENFVSKVRRKARCIGVDCAEGGDSTCICAVDEDGVIDLISAKTPDTSEIPDMVLSAMREHQCAAENVLFDRGGGGYEHVCTLNKMGFKVRSVSFGETASSKDRWKYFHTRTEKRIEEEEKTIYKNKRAELYGTLRDILNPAYETGFGIARRFVEIRQQLAPIPLWWEDGKLVLPPKNPKPDAKNPEEKITLIKLIGHSPDEADSLALAVYGMTHKPVSTVIRSMV